MTRPTIIDVARRAGTSPTAVCYAYTDPGWLDPVTRNRILQSAESLGYAPEPPPGSYASRTGTIGVLVPQALSEIFYNPFFTLFLQGVSAVCDEQELSLQLASPVDDSLNRALAQGSTDGFIIVGFDEHHHELAPLGRYSTPFVIVDGDTTTVSSINVDDESGAYAAAVHLLAKGHRQILCLAFEIPHQHRMHTWYGAGARRIRGIRRAYHDYHVTWSQRWIVPAPNVFENGTVSLTRAWRSGFRPTAVLACSDVLALGAIRGAQELGLDIPGDLEVIGFDDIALSQQFNPPLSTVHQPIVEKGQCAADLLIGLIGGRRDVEHIVFPTELVLRGTTR